MITFKQKKLKRYRFICKLSYQKRMVCCVHFLYEFQNLNLVCGLLPHSILKKMIKFIFSLYKCLLKCGITILEKKGEWWLGKDISF